MSEDDLLREFLTALDKLKKVSAASNLYMPGISRGDFALLHSIWEQCHGCAQGVMVSQLSTMRHISKPAISQAVSLLEKRGLVERTPDAHDRRIVRIHVTESGMELLEKSKKALREYTRRIVDGLGEQDTRELLRILDRLYVVLSGIHGGHQKETMCE